MQESWLWCCRLALPITSPGRAGPGGLRVEKLDRWQRWGIPSPAPSCIWVGERKHPNKDLGLLTQLPPKPTSRALRWPTSISTPSVSHWNMWREWSCWPNHRIAMTQDNSRIWMSSLSEGSVLMVQQKSQAFYQSKDSLQWTFSSKSVWTKGYNVWQTVTPNATMTNEYMMERQERWDNEMIFLNFYF